MPPAVHPRISMRYTGFRMWAIGNGAARHSRGPENVLLHKFLPFYSTDLLKDQSQTTKGRIGVFKPFTRLKNQRVRLSNRVPVLSVLNCEIKSGVFTTPAVIG